MSLESGELYGGAVCKRLKAEGIRAETCGSIRRKVKYIHDIDIIAGCTGIKLKDILGDACSGAGIEYTPITKTEAPKKFDCIIGQAPFNFYFATPENWGAMELFLTGNQLFNIILRGEAKKQGYKLSQYGLFHGREVVAGRTEGQIFDALGLKYVEPKDREVDNKFKLRRL
jgi:DNA polymerase (family 10)